MVDTVYKTNITGHEEINESKCSKSGWQISCFHQQQGYPQQEQQKRKENQPRNFRGQPGMCENLSPKIKQVSNNNNQTDFK